MVLQPIPGFEHLLECPVHPGQGGPAGWKCGKCPADAPPARLKATKLKAAPAGQAHEDALWDALEAAGLRDEGWHRQHGFGLSIGRRWRADFAHLPSRLAVEVKGGCHTIRARWKQDVEREAYAAALGWRMLPLTKEMVEDGTAVKLIRQALQVSR